MLPSLYVHVPFCSSRCTYCDFYSKAMSPASIRVASESWLLAISHHLELITRRFGSDGFKTIYIGGGTPSWLPQDILRNTLQLIGGYASASGQEALEWTVEANPEDIDETFLSILAGSGVGRLSIGVQSLQDEARRLAGRRGSASLIKERLESIASLWHGRWSCDLIFGLPGQSPEGLANDVVSLTGLGIGHVSLYELTLEPASPLSGSVQDGSVLLPDEDERADAYDAASEALINAGFNRYEVSNWALPTETCMHNEVYWEMGDWLALGPSGVGNMRQGDTSFLRMENASNDEEYRHDPTGSCIESTIAGKDAAFECLLTSLRTRKGCDLSRFKERFFIDPIAVFGSLHQAFPELIHLDGSSWKATQRGLDTLNILLVAALRHADQYYAFIDDERGEPLT